MAEIDLSDLFGNPAQIDYIPSVMTEGELSALIGLSTSRIRDLARDGLTVRSSRGRYDVRETLTRYIEALRKQASRSGRPASGDSDELRVEKLRLAREQADKLELANQAKRRELLPAVEVEREWSDILRHLRAAILALPSRIGQRVPALTQIDLASIDGELRDLLTELGNGG